MFIGIDIGGTKTHVRVVDAAGRATDTIVPTSSWQYDGQLADSRSIAALLALFEAQVSDPSRSSLVVGAHGCDSPQQIAELESALGSVFPGPIGVYNDAQLLGPAAGHPQAVALIAGTGAIAVGQDSSGAVVTAGGHGWLLTDPGSAPALAREAVRAVLARSDGGGGIDLLGEKLLDALGATNVNELAYEFTNAASMRFWAELAPLVFDAADEGSSDAVAVIDTAGGELVELVLGVLRKGAQAIVVIAAGGVVTNQLRLEQSIRSHLATAAPGLSIEVLRVAPVAGAIELARMLSRHDRPASTPRVLASGGAQP